MGVLEKLGIRAPKISRYLNEDGTPKTIIATSSFGSKVFGGTERNEKQLKNYWKYYEEDNMVFASVNTIAWNSVMVGYNIVSEDDKAKQLIQMMFDRMDLDGVLLDNVIYGLIFGDSFIEKVKGQQPDLGKKAKGKYTVSLKTVSPITVQINADKFGREETYQQKINGQILPTKLSKEDIIHLRFFPKPDTPYGISLIGPSKDSIDKMRDVDESLYNAIQRHGTSKFVVTIGTAEEIPPKAVFDRIKADLEDISSKNEFIVPGVIGISTIDEKGVPGVEAYADTFLKKTLVGLMVPQESLGLSMGSSTDACNDILTEVLTKIGWKYYYDLRDDDEIATYNPITLSLEFHKPLEPINKYIFKRNDKMIKIKTKSLDMLVTPNHRLWVRKHPFYNNRDWEFKTAEEIMNSKTTWAVKALVKHYDGETNLTEYEKQLSEKWGLDNFLKFIGYFISEGSLNGGSNCIRISQVKKDFLEDIRNTLNSSPFKVSEKFFNDKGYEWSFFDKEFHNYLMQNYGTRCFNKKIPRNIMNLPKENLEIILRTAINGDGTKGKGKFSYEYTSTSKELSESIQEIAIRCGYYTSIRFSEDKRPDRKGQWRVSIIKIRNDRDYYTLRYDNLSLCDYDNYVYSLNVPNHIYYTRRNGYTAIQGNTANQRALMFERFIKSVQQKLATKLRVELINQILIENGFEENIVYIRFNSVTDADEEAKSKWIGNLLRGFPEGKKPITINEVRSLYNLAPIKGGDELIVGDVKTPAIQPPD